MIADAPYIRDAEINGVGYADQTEEEYRSEQYRNTFLGELKKVCTLLSMATAILEGLPEDTVWDEKVTELADNIADMEFTVSSAANDIERW